MQISFVLSSLRLSGGVKAIIEISNRLHGRGHQVNLIVPGGTLDPAMVLAVKPGIVIKESQMRFSLPMNHFKLLALSFSLANAVPPSDIVISTHTPTTIPVLIAAHFLKRGKPIWYFLDYPEMFEERPIERWLLRHALVWHRGALTISEFCRQGLLDSNPHKPVINVSIGLSDPEIFQYHKNTVERELAWAGKKPILFVGDDRPRKGFYDFLRAAEKVYQGAPEIILWIVSKVNLQLSTMMPFRMFICLGNEELAELYRNCAVFVSASWVEGFGLPPLEAMACGAPVVMTDSQGVRDYARPFENCILVPPRAPQALADGILTILRDPALANRLRQSGPETAARFNWETTVDQFEQALIKWSKTVP
jgi:glycosyltransferase involved in cell wall biosynthesis